MSAENAIPAIQIYAKNITQQSFYAKFIKELKSIRISHSSNNDKITQLSNFVLADLVYLY